MHRDPMCELVDEDNLVHWVGLLDHFLEYPQDPPLGPDVLRAIERTRDRGGEVFLGGGGAAPAFTLRIAKSEATC